MQVWYLELRYGRCRVVWRAEVADHWLGGTEVVVYRVRVDQVQAIGYQSGLGAEREGST